MELSEITINGNTHLLSIVGKGSEKHNKFTLILGENGSGKTEVLKRIILSLLRANLKESTKSKYRDRVDDILHDNYKNQIENDAYQSKVKFLYEKEIYEIISSKSNSPRKITTFNGSTQTVIDGSFRHSDSIYKNGYIENKIPEINIIAITESPYSKLPVLAFEGQFSYYNIKAKSERDESRLNYYGDSKVDEKRSLLTKSIFLSQSESKNANFDLLFNELSIGNKIKFKFSRVGAYTSSNKSHDDIVSEILMGANLSITDEIKNNIKKDILNALGWLSNLTSVDDNPENKFQDRNHEFKYELKIHCESKEDVFISTLIEHKIIYPTSIEFNHNNEWHNSSSMSSGQLCFLNIFFGIASRIKDNSIIVIDEPEISLHPAWQSNFIVLLNKIFFNFKSCHFIMATHSPHIVSSLVENSYVVTIDPSQRTSSIHDWSNYGLRSIDFQLSEFFGYPGFKNEYINRELMQFLINISERKNVDTEQLDRVNKIISHKNKMDPDDPLLGLITMSEAVVLDVQNETL
jgi:predicted ATPase